MPMALASMMQQQYFNAPVQFCTRFADCSFPTSELLCLANLLDNVKTQFVCKTTTGLICQLCVLNRVHASVPVKSAHFSAHYDCIKDVHVAFNLHCDIDGKHQGKFLLKIQHESSLVTSTSIILAPPPPRPS
jgi:hypothetical protein